MMVTLWTVQDYKRLFNREAYMTRILYIKYLSIYNNHYNSKYT